MAQLFKALFCALILCGCSRQYPSVKTLYVGYLAERDVKKQNYEAALGKYYSMLEDDAERAGTHSNIGAILNGIQKPEDALKSLNYALELAQKSGDAGELYAIHFNLGVYYGGRSQYVEALEHYQSALDITPTSKEIKTNIELLMQQQKQQQEKENEKGGEDDKKEQDPSQDSSSDKGKQPDQPSDKKNEGDEPNDQDQKNDQKKPDESQKKESSPKYKPRPFKGDTLSEGDVKKILGELGSQEQKIRANFDKKEKGNSRRNEKDW